MITRGCILRRAASPAERGSVLTTLLIVMIPLLMMVTAATTVLTGRNSKLLASIQQQKALLAASAAIELAAQSAQAGTLNPDEIVPRSLGNGLGCSYVAVYLGSDGEDNDGDGMVDEADERAFEVQAEGTSGRASRRVSAVLIEPAPPPAFSAAILALGTPDIETAGTSRISGFDTRIDGGRGLPINDVSGVSTEPPHTPSDLLAAYTRNGTSMVVGRGRSPSFGVLPTRYNLPGLTASTRIASDNEIAPGTYTGSLGNAFTDDWQVTYCPGDLHLSGSRTGAGVLFVTGDLKISGSRRWDGLIIVLGELEVAGSSVVNGAVIQSPDGGSIKVAGGATIRYSSEAVRGLWGMIPRSFVIENWREVGR